jgi:pimeloyl-ACP methyl ester carboxylesterase
VQTRTCQGAHGARLTYRVVADPSAGPRTLLLAGGLGGSWLVWTGLIRTLRPRFRICVWDYPGLTAGRPVDPDLPVDVPSLAAHQAAVLDDAGGERAVLVGWSLGTQVAAEFFHRFPDRAEGLISICGLDGHPFVDDVEDEPIAAALGLRAAMPGAVGWLTERIDRIEHLRAMLRRIERPTRWAKRLGLVDPLADDLLFDAVVHDFTGLDPGTYRRYVEAAAAHDASGSRPGMRLPILAVAGERDRLVRPARVAEMARALPDAEYLEVRGATHFLPLEYPDLLALRIEDFLGRRLAP